MKFWSIKEKIKDESGSVMVITALSITALMVFASLTIDIGGAYLEAANAQNIADAVAISAGSYLPVSKNDTTAINTIKGQAKAYALKNSATELYDEDIILGNESNGFYHSLTIDVKKIAQTGLARVIGVESINLERSATSKATPAGSVHGAVPIGISKSVFDEAIASGNTKHITLKYGGGDGTGGFFGFLVLDGSNGNANILEKWLKYGFDGENYVDEVIPTASGNKVSAAAGGFEYRYYACTHYTSDGGCNAERYDLGCPRIIITLIYEQISDKEVKIVGFAPFILESVSHDGEIVGSYLKVNLPLTSGKIADFDCGTYNISLIS